MRHQGLPSMKDPSSAWWVSSPLVSTIRLLTQWISWTRPTQTLCPQGCIRKFSGGGSWSPIDGGLNNTFPVHLHYLLGFSRTVPAIWLDSTPWSSQLTAPLLSSQKYPTQKVLGRMIQPQSSIDLEPKDVWYYPSDHIEQRFQNDITVQ